MAANLPTYDPTNSGNKPGDGPLRVGGQPAADLTVALKENNPATMSHARERQALGLTLVRDVWEGAEKVRSCGPTYLPQAPGEDGPNYNIRLARSVFHNFFRRTVEGLVGLIYRKDPVLGDDVPPQIREQWENLDMAGTHGDVFLREITQDALIAGHAGILVEYPDTQGQRFTRAAETALKLRPYWVPVRKDDIVSWRTAIVDGRTILTQLVIRESRYAPAGEFGEKEVTTYRVLYLDADMVPMWRVLYVTERNAVVTVAEGVYTTQQEIPFAEIATSGKRGILDSDPPLLDLAYLNIAHYQQWSDYAFSIHKTCVPIFYAAGVQVAAGEKFVVGANTALTSPDPNAKFGYASHDGAALGSVKGALDDLKADMGALGLSMLMPQTRVAETAEAKQLDKSTQDSALSVLARSVQDAAERALGFHARYLGLPDGGSITINRDFEGLLLDASVMTAYAALVRDAGFPARLVLKALQAGGRIADDEDLEELELQMAVEAAAAEERKREELELQAEAARSGNPPSGLAAA